MIVYRLVQLFCAFVAFMAFCATCDKAESKHKVINYIACFLFLALILFIEGGLV